MLLANKGIKMSKLSKLTKVNDSLTVNRYDNGWMVEISGRDDEDDWKSTKILCNRSEEHTSELQSH